MNAAGFLRLVPCIAGHGTLSTASMLYGIADSGHRIRASKGIRAACPSCHGVLIPKCGDIIVHHWAHKESSDCPYAIGMTAWHYEWLLNFDARREAGWEVEYFLGSIRFDAFHPQKRQAIEFQRIIDLEYMKMKIAICLNEGIRLYWLISPRVFENFVYTGDYLGEKKHVLVAVRACRRKVEALLDAFLGKDNILFAIDFTRDTYLPRYAAERIDTFSPFWCYETARCYGYERQYCMPTGIYVIQGLHKTDSPHLAGKMIVFVDRRQSQFQGNETGSGTSSGGNLRRGKTESP